MAFACHRLKIARNPAISLGILFHSEAARDFLFNLGHPQVALRLVIGNGRMRVFSKQQNGFLMFFKGSYEFQVGKQFELTLVKSSLPVSK